MLQSAGRGQGLMAPRFQQTPPHLDHRHGPAPSLPFTKCRCFHLSPALCHPPSPLPVPTLGTSLTPCLPHPFQNLLQSGKPGWAL